MPTTSTTSASAGSSAPVTLSDLHRRPVRRAWCLRWSSRVNVITSYGQSDFQEADMPSRVLPYPVFDADNHFYEPKEALTQFLPDHRKNVVDYIEVRGRTKIMVRNQ